MFSLNKDAVPQDVIETMHEPASIKAIAKFLVDELTDAVDSALE